MSEIAKRMADKLVGAGTDAFWKAMPWIFLFIGVGLLAIAFFVLDSSTQPSWHGFTVGVASLILSAGVFAVLLKSYQYIQLFHDELLKIFSHDSFRRQLESVVRPTPTTTSELRSLVEPLVERYAAAQRKELSSGALQHLRHVLDIFEADGFYQTFKRTIRVKSYDQINKKLQIEDEFHIEVIPKNSQEPVLYRSEITSADSAFEHGTLTVNGKDRKDGIQVEKHTIRCNLDLLGSDRYILLRTYSRTLDLRVDPYINLRLTRAAIQLHVKVESHFLEDLNIIVRGIGFDTKKEANNFDVRVEERNNAGAKVQTINLSKISLTLPDEGYLIIFGVV